MTKECLFYLSLSRNFTELFVEHGLTTPEGKTRKIRTATEYSYKSPFGGWGPKPVPPFKPSGRALGWGLEKESVPTMLVDFKHEDYDFLFDRSPMYPEPYCYIISDETADLLRTFNLGRSQLTWLPPPSDVDPAVYRGAWTLWPVERYPTIIISKKAYNCGDPSLNGLTTFTYNPAMLTISGGHYFSLSRKKKSGWSPPCRQPDTSVDLWLDPLWPFSLFMSKRLVDALAKNNLLQGSEDGWRVVPCREPLPEELAEDQAQPWIRKISDKEWETMSEEDFIQIGWKAWNDYRENRRPPPDPFEGKTEAEIEVIKKRRERLYEKYGV